MHCAEILFMLTSAALAHDSAIGGSASRTPCLVGFESPEKARRLGWELY